MILVNLALKWDILHWAWCKPAQRCLQCWDGCVRNSKDEPGRLWGDRRPSLGVVERPGNTRHSDVDAGEDAHGSDGYDTQPADHAIDQYLDASTQLGQLLVIFIKTWHDWMRVHQALTHDSLTRHVSFSTKKNHNARPPDRPPACRWVVHPAGPPRFLRPSDLTSAVRCIEPM